MSQNSADIIIYMINENVFRVSRSQSDAGEPSHDARHGTPVMRAAKNAPCLSPGGDVGAAEPDDADQDTLRFTRGLVIGLTVSVALWIVLVSLGSGLVQLFWTV